MHHWQLFLHEKGRKHIASGLSS